MATRALRRVHSTTARSVRGVCGAPRRAVPRCASAALSTGVPRQPGVRDGPWTRRDADLVREALEEGSESKQPSEGKARKRAARAAERGKETFLLVRKVLANGEAVLGEWGRSLGKRRVLGECGRSLGIL